MKKLFKGIFVLFIAFLVTGCTDKTESGTTVNSESDMTKNRGILTCTREATGMNESEVKLSYEVSYNAGYITKLHSMEQVTTKDNETLNTYKQAYENIFKNYKDLKYYTNTITVEDNTVISDTVIEYDKVDLEKLKEIENTKDSVIKDGKVALKDWLEFAEKFGTKCTEK
ncbi:MAG: DUF1307 domain-containing protein [Bacilli bacterium]|nr:DUF1307 domain-containing protein [Bacilli bacterium]